MEQYYMYRYYICLSDRHYGNFNCDDSALSRLKLHKPSQ